MTKQASPITPDDQEKLRAGAAKRLPHAPSISLIGLYVEKIEPDDVAMRLPCREDLTNDGISYPGAAIASGLDTCGGLAVWSNHDFSKRIRASTAPHSIQNVGACRRSDLICRSTTVRPKRELTFVDIVGEDEDGIVLTRTLLTYRIVS